MDHSNRRGYYRVEYPMRDRPALIVEGRCVEVIDCSESGLRYAVTGDEPRPQLGMAIHGRVRFRGGAEVEVEGSVARVYGRSAAVRFAAGTGIPFSIILNEQKQLRRTYLTHLNQPFS